MSFKDVAISLLSSKKVLSAIAGIAVLIGVRYTSIPEEQLASLSLQITGLVATLLLGQGAADLGKAGKATEASALVAMTAMEAGFIEEDEEDEVD